MNRIANGVRNYVRAAAPSNGGNVNPFAQVKNILAKYGTDAHVYLPGIGVINGLTAGNYLDSAGTTAATVDNPVGLVLDGAGSVGAELVDTANTASAWLVYGSNTVTQNGAGIDITFVGGSNAGYGAIIYLNAAGGLSSNMTVGKTYVLTCQAKINTGSASLQVINGVAEIIGQTITSNSFISTQIIFTYAGTTSTPAIRLNNNLSTGEVLSLTNISVKEVTGIHATQATTANKPILRYASGRYYFDFVDGTDVLNATYPAGWESVTTIDAAPTGQATLTAQNIVGTYAITTDTYGRFVFKTITASELAIVQSYCNRLAGV